MLYGIASSCIATVNPYVYTLTTGNNYNESEKGHMMCLPTLPILLLFPFTSSLELSCVEIIH